MTENSMSFDIIIVGCGPSGLAAGIRLKQLAKANGQDISVCILEKASRVGAHIMSGAVIDPISLKKLLPESWKKAPLDTLVTKDKFLYLTKNQSFSLPVPKSLQNHNNYIIRLGELCVFLAKEAEKLGCEIYAGFPATKILYNNNQDVIGVETGEFGIDAHGNKTEHYQPGMQLFAKQTIFAEGCRGQLSEELIARYKLRSNCSPQTYGLGLKEVWQVPQELHHPGTVIHTVGSPLDHKTYGGSFIYHLSNKEVAIGFVVGLDYQNTWLDPFQEFQRFKLHPKIAPMLAHSKRTAFGARTLVEGGWQSIPKLSFPGGLIIGDSAGFLNVARIKGIHTAIESGAIAAQTCFENLSNINTPISLSSFDSNIKNSFIAKELYKVRNVRQGFRYGLLPGLIIAGIELWVTKGKLPITLKHKKPDNLYLKPASACKPIQYPKPDHVLTFDKLSSIYLSGVNHEENQPCHLKLMNPDLAISVNYNEYASPEIRYCPANVYEIILQDETAKLQINAQNCIHCKTCDIKDPRQNIKWKAPEGAGGPNYPLL